MRKLNFVITTFLVFIASSAFSANNETITGQVKILLIGDSTTEGGKLVFEKSIEQLIAGDDCTPPVKVINVCLGGETAYSL